MHLKELKIKVILFIVLITSVLWGCHSNTPKPIERKQLFNYDWKFQLGDIPDAKTEPFDDHQWRTLDLPHDWSIEGQPELHNPSGNDGGYYPTGIGWYRKTFHVPAEWKVHKVSIHFEGVYMNSEVFLNGTSLGVQPYGYTSFDYDLTPHLKYGQDNTLAVRVDNSKQKNSRWYTGTGIYRNVWLTITNPIHIAHWGVAITTPDVTDEKATVEVRTTVKNESDSYQDMVVFTEIKDKEGVVKGSMESHLPLGASHELTVVQHIDVVHPKLWSPESPNLYLAKISIQQKNEDIDQLTKSFGIRTLNFSTEHGFELNGKKVLLNGGCIHHDNGILGAAAYDRAEIRKVELMKAAGFNALRTSHNPPSEAFLDACDHLGMLVIDEAFDGWREMKTVFTPIKHDYSTLFDQWWEHDLRSMILRDRNHPSIIMWSIGNEIIERTEPQAVETAKMLSAAIKEIDTTRPVTSAMTTWGQGWEVFDPLMAAHDVAGYNYQLQEAESDHQRVPSRIIVNTESYPKDAFFIWDLVQKHNYIIGDFVWTAMDYLGESGIGRYYYPGEPEGEHWMKNLYPWHGSYCGDVDATGWRKPISHYRSMLYNNTEQLYMAVKEPNPENGPIKLTMWAVWPTWESWTWPGHEGKDIQVEVYSKYPRVRLYLNDQLIGEQLTSIDQEFKATFTLPYAPGTLKAVGVENDKETLPVLLKTAGVASKLKLTADRSTINADGQDLSYITVEITDDQGVLDPNAGNTLNFDTSGPGTIVGVGNANLKDTDAYVGDAHQARHGRALVIIKSTQEAGNITLEVSSSNLEKTSLTINSKK